MTLGFILPTYCFNTKTLCGSTLEPTAPTPVERPSSRPTPMIDTDRVTDCDCYECTSYVTPPSARSLSEWLASHRPDMLRLQLNAPRAPLPAVPWVPRPAFPPYTTPLSHTRLNVRPAKARRNKRRGGRRGAKRKASAAVRGETVTVLGGCGEAVQISTTDHFEVGCVIEDLVRRLPEVLVDNELWNTNHPLTAGDPNKLSQGFRLASLPRPPGPCACRCCNEARRECHVTGSIVTMCECAHCCAIHMGAAQRLTLQTSCARERAEQGWCSCCDTDRYTMHMVSGMAMRLTPQISCAYFDIKCGSVRTEQGCDIPDWSIYGRDPFAVDSEDEDSDTDDEYGDIYHIW